MGKTLRRNSLSFQAHIEDLHLKYRIPRGNAQNTTSGRNVGRHWPRHSVTSDNVCEVYPSMKEEIMNECGLKDRVPNFWSGANDNCGGQES